MSKYKKYTIAFAAALTCMMAGGVVHSQGMPRGNPPQEAFSACSGQSTGASCGIRTPHGRLSGTCQTPRQVRGLVCVPSNHRGRGHNRAENSGRGQPGQDGNRPPMRQHTVTQSEGIKSLYPATQAPITQSEFSSRVEGEWRFIRSNGISDHKTGQFPNAGNPNRISEQSFNVRIPAQPELGTSISRPRILGWLLNGVPFEPGAGEFYLGNRSSGWQYEALSGAVRLGLDHNHAHVQPNGKYHYHGLPTLFLQKMGVHKGAHSPQVGWAADGFPIYALYGYAGFQSKASGIKEMRGSYRVKQGARPSGSGQPGGTYDGTFTRDYEYIKGLGDLDECNGKWTVTPEYPNGTYAYFLTQNYPVVPRCLKGKNVADAGERRPRR